MYMQRHGREREGRGRGEGGREREGEGGREREGRGREGEGEVELAMVVYIYIHACIHLQGLAMQEHIMYKLQYALGPQKVAYNAHAHLISV